MLLLVYVKCAKLINKLMSHSISYAHILYFVLHILQECYYNNNVFIMSNFTTSITVYCTTSIIPLNTYEK